MKQRIITCLVFFASAANASPAPVKVVKNEVPGTMYFSNQPFTNSNGGGKKSFKSNEYIYGRLELNGASIKEAFKVKEGKNPYLICQVTILQNGEEVTSTDNNYLLLTETGVATLNFDILPEPSRATSVFSMLDDFSAGVGFDPLYLAIINQRLSDGDYTVRVKLYSKTLDGWGKDQEPEKWPFFDEEFAFHFSDTDAMTISKNKELLADLIKENSFRYEKLPDVFANPGKLTDPEATAAKIAAILKRDLPERTILKFVAESVSGIQWHIAKDDYGLPRYRYFNPDIYVAYKMNGKCYVGTVTLRQVYQGGGSYGPLEVAFTSAGEQPDRGIDCIKVK